MLWLAMSKPSPLKGEAIFDVLYGFIPITPWEAEIIDSPLFQRLRWIKQLGFSCYIFPGAEHNRFSHAIGVMHSMQKMLAALDIAVSDRELVRNRSRTKESILHRNLRVAALLHDIGTFPFSHAIEHAYTRHGKDQRRARNRQKNLPNNHEHLGSFIIKNTNYKGGITYILKKWGLDPQMISDIIKGESPYPIANQLMHSDLDADRMDYLMRDSHYTGLKYGQYDREFILSNLTVFSPIKGKLAFGVKESATQAVEDFLMSRFNWYSQVIRNPDSAKFDIMGAYIAGAFLEQDVMHQFQDLLNMIETKDLRFFWWNDVYFMSRCQELFYHKKINDNKARALTENILFRKAPKTLKHPLLKHRIIHDKKSSERKKLASKIGSLVKEFEAVIKKHGTERDWILADIPKEGEDVMFSSRLKNTAKGGKARNLHLERNPVKIVAKDGSVSLLVEKENSLMRHLAGFVNFFPSVYASESAEKLLRRKKLIV